MPSLQSLTQQPLGDRDANANPTGGRTSRASRASNQSSAAPPTASGAATVNEEFNTRLLYNFFSLTTPIGNIGPGPPDFALHGDVNHLSKPFPNPNKLRSSSRQSAGSSRSVYSEYGITSQGYAHGHPHGGHHRAHPSESSAATAPTNDGPRTSMMTEVTPAYVHDTLSPTLVNIPGTSPLIPHYGRTQSLTHAYTNEGYRASGSSKRLKKLPSTASFQSLDQVYHPSGPRFGAPGSHRSGSPAMSDYNSGSQPRHRCGGVGQARLRSGYSGAGNHRPLKPHPHPPGHYSRRPLLPMRSSYNWTQNNPANAGTAPRRLSISNSMTQVVTDTDVPSSDPLSSLPPTPKDGASQKVANGAAMRDLTWMKTTTGAESRIDTFYLDGSEEWHPSSINYPNSNEFGRGFSSEIKSPLKISERVSGGQKTTFNTASIEETQLSSHRNFNVNNLSSSPDDDHDRKECNRSSRQPPNASMPVISYSRKSERPFSRASAPTPDERSQMERPCSSGSPLIGNEQMQAERPSSSRGKPLLPDLMPVLQENFEDSNKGHVVSMARVLNISLLKTPPLEHSISGFLNNDNEAPQGISKEPQRLQLQQPIFPETAAQGNSLGISSRESLRERNEVIDIHPLSRTLRENLPPTSDLRHVPKAAYEFSEHFTQKHHPEPKFPHMRTAEFSIQQPTIAELPASPVPKRITKDMIKAALDPITTTDDLMISPLLLDSDPLAETATTSNTRLEGYTSGHTEISNGTPVKTLDALSTLATLEQIATPRSTVTIPESSTLEFAAHAPHQMATQTEDGMSDLLEGYQHSESRNEDESGRIEENLGNAIGKANSHSHKSSDSQSFKSCNGSNEPPEQESDAKPFKIVKDAVTPDRVISMQNPKLPSRILTQSEQKSLPTKASLSAPLATTPGSTKSFPVIGGGSQSIGPRDPSITNQLPRTFAISKLNTLHGSKIASISSTNSALQGPIVPLRASSSSREARQIRSAGAFLMGLAIGGRKFSSVGSFSSLGKKSIKNESLIDHNGDTKRRGNNVVPEQRETGKSKMDRILEKYRSPRRKVMPRDIATIIQQSEGRVNSLEGNTDVKPSEKSTASFGNVTTESSTQDDAIKQNRTVSEERAGQCISEIVSTSNFSKLPSGSSSQFMPLSSSVYSSELGLMKSGGPTGTDATAPWRADDGQNRDSNTTTHLSWSHPRSLGYSSVYTSRSANGMSLDDTTTDLRLSNYRYPNHHLPDLKEDSHEDSSLNTSASNVRNSNFRFPVGQPQVGISISVDDARVLPSSSLKQSTLPQTRALPSMHFSAIDLIALLNDTAGMRASRSMDDNRRDSVMVRQSAERPSTAGPFDSKHHSVIIPVKGLSPQRIEKDLTANLDVVHAKLPCLQKEYLAELDNLSIPSVGGLTQRISEMIPSLKQYMETGKGGIMDVEDQIMENALGEIHEVGGPTPKRSSARLRPLPGHEKLVVILDGVYEDITSHSNYDSEGTGDVVDGETESAVDDDSRAVDAKKRTDTSQLPGREKTPLAELEAPMAAALCTRSLSLGAQPIRPSLESRWSSRLSARSLGSSPTVTDSRPWNLEKNYPWAITIQSIDVSLPVPALVRDSSGATPACYSDSAGETAGQLPAPSSPVSPVMPMPGSEDPFTHARRSHAIYRLSSYLPHHHHGSNDHSSDPVAPGFDASGNLTGPLQIRGSDQSHNPGERYPTSGLTPPAIVNDNDNIERRSHFSDDSDDEPRNAIKRGFVSMKSKITSSNRSPLANMTSAGDSLHDQDERDFSARRQTFDGAEGIPKHKYYVHKALETVKGLFRRTTEKGKEFFRNLSIRDRESRSDFLQNAESIAYVDVDGHRRVLMEGSRGTALYTGV